MVHTSYILKHHVIYGEDKTNHGDLLDEKLSEGGKGLCSDVRRKILSILLNFFFFFTPQDMWDLSSLTKIKLLLYWKHRALTTGLPRKPLMLFLVHVYIYKIIGI